MPDTQARIIGYVTADKELLGAHYEDESKLDTVPWVVETEKRHYRYLIRKCPPHVADWIISTGSYNPYFGNGHKAWDYLVESGAVLRQI